MRLTRTNRIIFLQIALRTSILIKKNKLSFFLHSISFDLLKFFQQVDYNILKYNGIYQHELFYANLYKYAGIFYKIDLR